MQNFTDMKATELRELVKANDAALAALAVPVSRAKKDELVAALKAVEQKQPKKVGNRSFTGEQADEVVYLRHEELQSWRQIANRLRLGSPGVARRAYRHATGCDGVVALWYGCGTAPGWVMVAEGQEPVLACGYVSRPRQESNLRPTA